MADAVVAVERLKIMRGNDGSAAALQSGNLVVQFVARGFELLRVPRDEKREEDRKVIRLSFNLFATWAHPRRSDTEPIHRFLYPDIGEIR